MRMYSLTEKSPHTSLTNHLKSPKGGRKSVPHKKKRESFIVIHWLVQNAKLKRREEKSGHSWVQMLSRGETPMYGLCSRCVKLFKRGVNAIHQIVWNCVKISETIWPPNVRVFFMWLDTLVSVWWTAGVQPCAIVTCHIRVDGSFVLSFHALRWKLQLHPWTKRII